METYEITFITRSEEETGGVADAIAHAGGRITSQASPLRRKLAYPIKKETTGVYHTHVFEMEATKVRELNAKLSRNDAIIRHLIIAGGIRKPLEQPSKLKNLEVPESVTKGLTAEETADKPTETPVAKESARETQATQEEAAQEATAAEPAQVVETETAEKSPASAEEVTAEERQKKLDEKLKSILGE